MSARSTEMRSVALVVAIAFVFGGMLTIAPVVSHADTSQGPKVRVKMAFVDVERAVGETEDGLRAKATLKKITDHKQTAIVGMEERLKKQEADLSAQAQAAKGPNSQLAAGVLAYQRELQTYNETLKRINNELAWREDELFGPIEKKVKSIMAHIGEKEGYDLIVDKKAVQSFKPELDLTERVIREYNWGAAKGALPASSAGK